MWCHFRKNLKQALYCFSRQGSFFKIMLKLLFLLKDGKFEKLGKIFLYVKLLLYVKPFFFSNFNFRVWQSDKLRVFLPFYRPQAGTFPQQIFDRIKSKITNAWFYNKIRKIAGRVYTCFLLNYEFNPPGTLSPCLSLRGVSILTKSVPFGRGGSIQSKKKSRIDSWKNWW